MQRQQKPASGRPALRARHAARGLATALLLIACFSATAAIEELKPGERPPSGSDEDQLWYAMERAERELQQSPRLVRDPALNDYVRTIACKVAGDYCPDLRVYIMEQPWFNATMAPNGMMVIWTGALLRMHDEAELAMLLGHEYAHFRARHSLQQWRKLKRTTAFSQTFSMLTLGAGVGLLGIAGDLVGAAGLYGFSRDKEREADQDGFATITALGYDPQAGVRLWERMQREEKAQTGAKSTPVFATHPATAERVTDVREAARALASPGSERGRDAYYGAIRPHLADWLEDELARRMYDASLVVIRELHEDGQAQDAGLLDFYLAEALRRRSKGDDRDRAVALYAQVVTQPGAPAGAWREHALALREQGRSQDAIQAFQRYLELAPGADDQAFIERYLSDLKESP